jgi:hypothetical protein
MSSQWADTETPVHTNFLADLEDGVEDRIEAVRLFREGLFAELAGR